MKFSKRDRISRLDISNLRGDDVEGVPEPLDKLGVSLVEGFIHRFQTDGSLTGQL